MVKVKTFLTTEKLQNKFENNFDLANFAIKEARERIDKEEEVYLDSLLGEIAEKTEENE